MENMSMQSEEINHLAEALSKAQGKMGSAKQDKVNPFYKSKYADLASVWDACRSVLAENGLSVIQTMMPYNNLTVLVTTLTHSSGQWIRSWLPIHPAKNDPQSLGSCITYMKRYALAAIVGIATEDDDGEKATQHSRQKKKETITTEQFDELDSYIDDNTELRANMLKYLKERHGVTTLQDMPQSLFETYLSRAKKAFIQKNQIEDELAEAVGG